MDSEFDHHCQDHGLLSSVPPAEDSQGHIDPLECGVTPRDIILLNVAIAAAQDRRDELRSQLALALMNDVTPAEIADILEQAACHSGHSLDDHVNILVEALRGVGGREQAAQ